MAKLAFLGTPAVAAGVLNALHAAGHEIALVVSRPDRRRGRGGAVTPSPVKATALQLGLPVTERPEDVLATAAELGVVVAYGRIIRPPLLGGIDLVNLHLSLLPRWRGAAPVERAILAGDAETGVCLMAIDEGLDTGPVHGCVRTPIGPDETADQLRVRLAGLGAELLLERLGGLPASLGPAVAQTGEATIAAKLEPGELELDWSRPAIELHRLVRVGRAHTTWQGKRLLVHRSRMAPAPEPALPPGSLAGGVVATGDGGLELLEVQLEGRAAQPFEVFARGARLGKVEKLARSEGREPPWTAVRRAGKDAGP
jgi:methionyl-tRNA formyltransferase